MGGRGSKSKNIGNRPITITILGLDGSGKTTTANVLKRTPIDSVTPTIGFVPYELIHKNENIKLYDLGGDATFRESWRHYFDDSYGFIYVVDSSEQTRLDENHVELKQLLQEEKVQNKPILILANKQDKPNALDKNAIIEYLKIERLVTDNQSLCRVELCTATRVSSDRTNSQIDPSIENGFDWLIKTIYENYDILHKRVEKDIEKRDEDELKAKNERRRIVLIKREERAKQEGTENDDPITNGFVPIEQAIKNAEMKSTAAH